MSLEQTKNMNCKGDSGEKKMEDVSQVPTDTGPIEPTTPFKPNSLDTSSCRGKGQIFTNAK